MTVAYYPQAEALTPVSRPHSAGRRQLAGCLLLGLLLGGCSSTGSHRSGTASPRYGEPSATTAVSNEVLIRAISLVGTPYRYGGNTPESGFDCSGLVDFVFQDAAGLRLPRSTRELIEMDAPAVRRDQLLPGDLVFFSPDGGKVSHIGIYVGEGRFVHAPSAGGTVRLDLLDTAYWKQAFRSAKRVLH